MRYVKDLGQSNLVIYSCIISYPHLFAARRVGRPGNQSGEPRYSGNFILPADLDQDDLNTLGRIEQEACAKLWGNNIPPNLKNPWSNASEASPQMAGRFMLKAGQREDQGAPNVFDPSGARMDKSQTSQIFAGCIVDVHLRAFAYNTGSNGWACAINGVMLKDNMNVERLDNRMSSETAFGIPQTGFPAATAPVPDQPGPQVPASQQVGPAAALAPQQPGVTAGPSAPSGPSFLD